MSGHSKWAKIKRAKGISDVKKGAIFTKLARNIILAAKEGGGDPDTNFSLRIVVDKAKAVNMPSDNIERSIKKGTGSDEKVTVSRISYEAVANHGVNMMIDSQTDNSNRTVSEIKKILENGGAKLASIGSVSWQFQELGLIVIKPARLIKAEKFGGQDTYTPVNSEEIELELLEIPGIEDIIETEQEDEEGKSFKVLEIYTNKNDFSKVVKHVENFQYQILSFELIKKAKDPIELSDEALEKTEHLIETLEEHDDIDSVWTNLK
jgi:YebC/PmpR family DNA-binding regulatory protein